MCAFRPYVAAAGVVLLLSGAAAAQTLPARTGPYPVGTGTLNWIDAARPEASTPASGDRREVAAQLWYPAADVGQSHASYFPEIDAMVEYVRADSRAPEWLAGALEAYGRITVDAGADAPIAVRGAPFPVLVFSPGGNMSRHYHTALAVELASHGYVVAVISHAYSGWDVYARDGVVMSSNHWWGSEEMSEAQQQEMVETLNDALAGDASFVLDRLAAMSHDGGGPFAGAFDLSRVAIAGHSRGGKTVGRACSSDARFRVAIVLDNIGPERERGTGLAQPLLTIRTAAERWSEERTGALHDYLRRTGSVAYEVIVDGAVHNSFSDLPLIDFEHYPSDIDPMRAHAIIARCARAFLDAHLPRGEDSALESTLSGIPELHVTRFGNALSD